MKWLHLLLVALFIRAIKSKTSSFKVSFQESNTDVSQLSTDEWVEYIKEIQNATEFTACHWMFLRYFAQDAVGFIWSYCIQPNNENVRYQCIQLGLYTVAGTAGRKIRTTALLFDQAPFSTSFQPLLHRTWAHLCWSYSSIIGRHSMFLNGELVGMLNQSYKGGKSIFKNINSINKSAFIIGQEPDDVRGGFDQREALSGEIAELNIWDHILSKSKIASMASCKEFPRGNIVSWNEKFLKFNNVIKTNMDNAARLCEEKYRYITSPIRQTFRQANITCKIHGAKLALPQTQQMNDLLVKKVDRIKKSCSHGMGSGKQETRTWLGWLPGIGNTSYSNWADTEGTHHWNRHCAYMNSEGLWRKGKPNLCQNMPVCAICSLSSTSPFTLKGTCKESQIDFNYYLALDDENQILEFDGYKTEKIVHQNNQWTIVPKNGPLFWSANITMAKDRTPVGRFEWDFYDPNCNFTWPVKRNMTLSNCDFESEYTCNNGVCISHHHRCNGFADCHDGSDEEGCSGNPWIPASYLKELPPKHHVHKHDHRHKMLTQVLLTILPNAHNHNVIK